MRLPLGAGVGIKELPALGDFGTDKNGVVSFQNIPESQKVTLQVRKIGYIAQEAEISANRTMKVDNSIEIKLMKVPKKPQFIFYGEVNDKNKADVKGASVEVSILGKPYSAISDESGNYQIIIDGELMKTAPNYKIEVKKDGCVSYKKTYPMPKQELVFEDIDLSCETKEIKKRNLIVAGVIYNQGKYLGNATVLLRVGDIKKEAITDYLGNYSINMILEDYYSNLETARLDVRYNDQCNKSIPIDLPKDNSLFKDIDLNCTIESAPKIEKEVVPVQLPEPNIEKIKSDLIGRDMPCWNFAYLKEFINSEVINTIRGNNRLEFDIKFLFEDYIDHSNHESEVYIVYTRGAQSSEWSFHDLKMIYYTSYYLVPSDGWKKIAPCKNCYFSISDDCKLWVKTANNDTVYKTGSDSEAQTLPFSTLYYFSSREGSPCKMRLTFKPKI